MIRLPLQAYAEAYVAAMPDRKDPVGELTRVYETLNATPELASFIADPSISTHERSKALNVAASDLAKETVNIVLLIASHRLLKKMDRLIACVRDAFARSTNSRAASATAAVPLTDKERKEITKILEQKTGTHVTLTERIDPAIGGGLLIQLGDWEFDATVAGRLRRMKHALNTV
jgi:F-type H+-transporting ATPase subunit delta